MKQSISKSEFKARALHYFRQVQKTGKSLVITERGRPVLKVVPYSEDPARVMRELRHSVLKYESPSEPVALEDWESSK